MTEIAAAVVPIGCGRRAVRGDVDPHQLFDRQSLQVGLGRRAGLPTRKEERTRAEPCIATSSVAAV